MSPKTISPAAASAPPEQYLSFSLDGATLALPILRVSEIIEVPTITAVPLMPPFVRGVLNLRGAVVPVVDLKARFGRGPAVLGRRSCVVIVELHGQKEGGDEGHGGDAPGEADKQDIGVLVDQVNAVVEINEADIEPPPAFGVGLRPDFIQGMGRMGDRFVVLLAIDNLLCVAELAAAAAAAALDASAADSADSASREMA